jgi:hypothetical protein
VLYEFDLHPKDGEAYIFATNHHISSSPPCVGLETHIVEIQKLYDESDKAARVKIKKDSQTSFSNLEDSKKPIWKSFNAVRRKTQVTCK